MQLPSVRHIVSQIDQTIKRTFSEPESAAANEAVSDSKIRRVCYAGASLANKPAANGTEIASARVLYLSKSAKGFRSQEQTNKRTGMMVFGLAVPPCDRKPAGCVQHISN